MKPIITKTHITLDFPEVTMEGLFKKHKGKFPDGSPMLWSGSKWMKKEPCWKEQKSRPGKRTVNLQPVEKGKNWYDCKSYAEKQGGQMLNLPELFYVMIEYNKATGKRILENEWTLLDTPVIGEVGFSGDWDGYGPFLGGSDAWIVWSGRGLVFSCNCNDEIMIDEKVASESVQDEELTLEQRIERLENWARQIAPPNL